MVGYQFNNFVFTFRLKKVTVYLKLFDTES